MKELLNVCPEHHVNDPETFTKLVLDYTMPTLRHLHISPIAVSGIELWSREYLNKLHYTRLKLLKERDSGATKARNLTY